MAKRRRKKNTTQAVLGPDGVFGVKTALITSKQARAALGMNKWQWLTFRRGLRPDQVYQATAQQEGYLWSLERLLQIRLARALERLGPPRPLGPYDTLAWDHPAFWQSFLTGLHHVNWYAIKAKWQRTKAVYPALFAAVVRRMHALGLWYGVYALDTDKYVLVHHNEKKARLEKYLAKREWLPGVTAEPWPGAGVAVKGNKQGVRRGRALCTRFLEQTCETSSKTSGSGAVTP